MPTFVLSFFLGQTVQAGCADSFLGKKSISRLAAAAVGNESTSRRSREKNARGIGIGPLSTLSPDDRKKIGWGQKGGRQIRKGVYLRSRMYMYRGFGSWHPTSSASSSSSGDEKQASSSLSLLPRLQTSIATIGRGAERESRILSAAG